MTRRSLIIIGIIITIAAVIMTVFVLSYRTITVVSGKQYVDHCPRIARPGQKITIYTVDVSDGEIDVSGIAGEYIRPGTFLFTMPDRNVKIKVSAYAYADGA